jgi:hypothetical protein
MVTLATSLFKSNKSPSDQPLYSILINMLSTNFYGTSKMFVTRSEAKKTFNHVLDNVLVQADGSSLKSALVEEGIDVILALHTVTKGPT